MHKINLFHCFAHVQDLLGIQSDTKKILHSTKTAEEKKLALFMNIFAQTWPCTEAAGDLIAKNNITYYYKWTKARRTAGNKGLIGKAKDLYSLDTESSYCVRKRKRLLC